MAIALFGRAISLPTEPHLDASLDLVLGLVLVLAVTFQKELCDHEREVPRRAGGEFTTASPTGRWRSTAPGAGS